MQISKGMMWLIPMGIKIVVTWSASWWVPRTSSKSFHFGESNKRTVQELCQWAANQSWISSDLTVSLSSVQPGKYFDLTCKLLARTIKDSRCILLKVLSAFLTWIWICKINEHQIKFVQLTVTQCDQVWDGTKCQHPLLNVAVASDTLEEESTVA